MICGPVVEKYYFATQAVKTLFPLSNRFTFHVRLQKLRLCLCELRAQLFSAFYFKHLNIFRTGENCEVSHCVIFWVSLHFLFYRSRYPVQKLHSTVIKINCHSSKPRKHRSGLYCDIMLHMLKLCNIIYLITIFVMFQS